MLNNGVFKKVISAIIILSPIIAMNAQASNYETFKAALEINSKGSYIVEGDIPIRSEASLQEYYNSISLNASGSSDLIVSTVNGVDEIWSDNNRRNISYCVSTSFGVNYNDVVNDMREAVSAWQTNGLNVNFFHHQAEDTNCDSNNTNVMFDVVPELGAVRFLAVAFFPFEERQDRTLLITTSGLNAATVPLVGVLRHELGHVLGFRHEHTRPDSRACFEDNNWRILTDYDSNSVMHYPQCNGTGGWALDLTDFDRQGARDLYGIYEDFEDNMSLQNTGQFSWFRDSSGTPSSSTGPLEGANSSSYYAYFETSSGYAYQQGNEGYLETADFEVVNPQLSFDYHMFGSDTGDLFIDVFQNNQWILNVWSRSGQQQFSNSDDWDKATVNLSSYSGRIRIRLRTVAAGSYRGDIAVDNILIGTSRMGCNSNETPVGSILQNVYNADGSLHFAVVVANEFDIQPGSLGSIDVRYEWQSCDYNYGCDGVREQEYNECSLDGNLGINEDEGNGDFVAYPACWQRTVGFIECP